MREVLELRATYREGGGGGGVRGLSKQVKKQDNCNKVPLTLQVWTVLFKGSDLPESVAQVFLHKSTATFQPSAV